MLTQPQKEWRELPFSDCLQKVAVGREKQIQEKDYLKFGEYPVVDQGQSFIAGYTDNKSKVISDIQPFIIFGDHTRTLKYIDFPVVLGADGTKVIKPNNEFDTKFFFYTLKHIDVPSRGYNRHFTLLKEKNIALPSLAEQRAIAQTLTTMQNAIAEQEKLILKLKELKRTMMQHLFTHGTEDEKTKMTEVGEVPESWVIKKLGQLVDVSSGGTPSRKNSDYWTGGTIPWVKTTEIDYAPISSTEEKITEQGLKNSSAKLFPKGTLLMAMYGQGVTRGRVAMLNIKATTNQACSAFLGDEETNKYLYYFLTHSYESIRQLGHGANQKNLNASLIKAINIPVCDAREMKKIVSALEATDTKTGVAEERLQSYKNLFKTLLHELISGERRV